MRPALFVMISLLCACAGKGVDGPGVRGPSADVQEYSALAWVPGQPTYMMTAHTVREAQRSVSDMIDSFGMMVGANADELGHELEQVLGVDPLAETGTQKLGIDPSGSIALYSEGTDPTIVIRLGAPDVARAFFDLAKTRGGKTTSLVVDGVEVTSVTVVHGVTASWAIDKDWLWVHFAFGADKDPDAQWFLHTHHRPEGSYGWQQNFKTATNLRDKLKHDGLLGYLDSHALIALARAHAPKSLTQCLDRFTPIGVAGFAIEGDGQHAAGQLAFDLGPAAKGVAAALLPPPGGFAAVAQTAPIAIQWNLDIGAIASFLSPCLETAGGNTNFLTKYGLRSGRVAIQTLSPSDRSGTGVVSADLSDKSYLAGLLDMVPRRSMFESNHTFGGGGGGGGAGVTGHRISVPFLITIDYVLDDRTGLLAVGEGLMDKLVAPTPAPAATPPLFAIDLIIPGLSPEVWKFLIGEVTNEWFAKRAVEQLQRWHDGHVSVTIDHDLLVIDAAGNRR
ncbi:MAG: hypothetical protein ABI591_09530 [Kofleriaceae bacterium]